MNVIRMSVVCVLCLLLPMTIGCNKKGPKLVKAGGTVMYKGAPVSGATVTFLYPDKDMATGSTDESGKFTMSTGGRAGAPVGEAKVSVSKKSSQYNVADVKPEDLRPDHMIKMAQKAKEGAKDAQSAVEDLVPKKYENPETSELKANVPAEGVEDLQFTLVD
jgi:hypothetical protein